MADAAVQLRLVEHATTIACTRCGIVKPRTSEYFRLHKETRPSGESYRILKRTCRRCEVKATGDYHKIHREKANEATRARYRKYPHLLRQSNLRKYGLTIAQYSVLLESQNGVCAICQRPEVTPSGGTKRPRSLAVDHDHGTGRVRALLCSHCNKALGCFMDSPAILDKAAEYLRRHGK